MLTYIFGVLTGLALWAGSKIISHFITRGTEKAIEQIDKRL